jgi:hypothetical protein
MELADRVAELQSDVADRDRHLLLSPDEDPEILRERIAGFIDTIDRYLERYHDVETVGDETTFDASRGQESPDQSNS